MIRRLLGIVIVIVLVWPSPAPAASDLVRNGLFSRGVGGQPEGWRHEAFNSDPSATRFTWTAGAAGIGTIGISSLQPNDARWIQTVPVTPSKSYWVSGWIRTENVGEGGGLGGYITIMDRPYISGDIRGTHDWQRVGFWAKAGPGETTLELACRLGGYSALNTGTAYFTGISFEEVETFPVSGPVVSDADANDWRIGSLMAALIVPALALLLCFWSGATGTEQGAVASADLGGHREPGEEAARMRAREAAKAAPSIRSRAARSLGDWTVARGFFTSAVAVVAADAAYLVRSGRSPNEVAMAALFAAIVGLGLLPLSRRRAESKASVRLPLPSAQSWSFFAIFVAFLAFYAVTGSSDATPFNEPTLQANAFVHGRAWVSVPGFMEHVRWQGRTYLVHPPFSAILLTPLVAIWGLSTNQTIVCLLLGAFEIALAWRLLGLLGLTITSRVWLTIFFGAGTTLWYESTVGNSWDFILVASVAMTLLTLNELFGKARPAMVGILAALAGLTRYDLMLAWPIYALMLWARGRRWRQLLWMAPGFVLAAVVYIVFNEVRYGTVSDISLWIYYPTDPHRFSHPAGPFSLRYLPENLYTVLFMAPNFNDRFPYIHPSMTGQSLILTSPALLLALRANFRRPIPILVGLAAILASGAPLLCYANGFVQLGSRYYLEIFPFLLVLMALGVRRRVDQMSRILIVASIVMVTFGVWHVRMFGFG